MVMRRMDFPLVSGRASESRLGYQAKSSVLIWSDAAPAFFAAVLTALIHRGGPQTKMSRWAMSGTSDWSASRSLDAELVPAGNQLPSARRGPGRKWTSIPLRAASSSISATKMASLESE